MYKRQVEPVVVPEPVVETKPVEVEKVVEEVKKEEPKVDDGEA